MNTQVLTYNTITLSKITRDCHIVEREGSTMIDLRTEIIRLLRSSCSFSFRNAVDKSLLVEQVVKKTRREARVIESYIEDMAKLGQVGITRNGKVWLNADW